MSPRPDATLMDGFVKIERIGRAASVKESSSFDSCRIRSRQPLRKDISTSRWGSVKKWHYTSRRLTVTGPRSVRHRYLRSRQTAVWRPLSSFRWERYELPLARGKVSKCYEFRVGRAKWKADQSWKLALPQAFIGWYFHRRSAFTVYDYKSFRWRIQGFELKIWERRKRIKK